MKRIVSIFTVIVAIIGITSCAGNGAYGGGEADKISFSIISDSDELSVGEGVFTFSPSEGSRLGEYTAEDILYTVNGYPIIGNSFLPMDPGTYTVTANVGGTFSSNTLTLTVR